MAAKDPVEAEQHAQEIIQAKPKRKWQSYIWDSLDKTPEERRFLFKIDTAILTFASLGYLIKFLDQANVNNAFVSGMKEDLGLYGNQLNYMQTLWTVGYVIGETPSNLILTRVRPSIWIPTLELIWSVLTICLSKCKTAEQLYAVRFLVGLAESGFYPGMQYVIGSWYRSDELAKRSCIFQCSSAVATMFSGYLMAAVYHLHGVGGFRGWQWLFLIDGIISLPIALAGYFMIPDMPDNCRAVFINEKDRAMAQRRMELEGRKGREPYTKAKVLRMLSSWRIWVLTLLGTLYNNGSAGVAPVFAQFLKNSTNPKYQIWQINVYPSATYGFTIFTTLAYAWTSDSIFRGARWPAVIVGGLINILTMTSLAVWDIPVNYKWFCFIFMGGSYGLSGIIFAWAQEVCTTDSEERALVTGIMNVMGYVVQAWLPLIVWQQVDAPRYQKGYISAACISVLMIATAMLTRTLQQREEKNRLLENQSAPQLTDSDDSYPTAVVVHVDQEKKELSI